jgi:hypothetical protein
MAVQAFKGVFTKRTGTGAQAVTGVGFTPKAVIFWWVNQTAHGLVDTGARISFGFDDGTNGVATGHHSSDNVATTDTSRAFSSTNSLILYDADETVDSLGAIQSMDADGFTVNWSTAAGSAGVLIHYLAIGGDDASAFAGHFISRSGTGDQAVTGVGFEPEGLLFLEELWTTVSAVQDSYGGALFGAATASNQWAAIADTADNQNPSITIRQLISTACILKNPISGNVHRASLVSMDADGFTVNWSANATQGAVAYLALRGATFAAGTFTQRTTTGTHSITTPTMTPRAVLLCSIGHAASTDRQNQNRLSLGASDGGRQGVAWVGDEYNVTPTRGAVFSSATDAVVAIDTVAATGSASTIAARGQVTALQAGRFVVNWSVVDATARQVAYFAIGDPIEDAPEYDVQIGDETGLNPLRETFRIQETLDAPDTAIMDFESAGSPFTRFSLGQAVYVTENGVRIFGGYVTGVRERGFSGPNGVDLVVEVQATSYELNAQRRVITETFSQGSPASETIGEALQRLVDDYYGITGVTLHPDQVDGPVLPALTFERVRGDQVNAQIAESVGYLYSIDFENRLRAWAPGDIEAPEDYDEDTNPEMLTGDIEVEKQLQNGYANKVILVGEPIVVPDHIDSFVGDGAEDTFDLTYKIGGPFPYVADGAIGYGVVRYTADNSTESIGGLEAPVGYFWEYDPIAKTIRRRAAAPGNGVQFTIQYHGLFIPEATAEDAAEISALGLYEHVEEVTAVTSDVSAQELADALLAQKIASKSEIATLYTRDLGFHPGQTIGIESPLRELTGSFLITQVDSGFLDAGVRIIRKITAAKSENNDHDWRKVIQQWSEGSSVSSSTGGSASSTTSSAGSGSGLHAGHHEAGGIDEVIVEALPTGSGTLGDVLTNDGSGGASWEAPTGSGSPSGSDPADIVLTSAYASRVAAATEGRLFLPSNGLYVERDTSAAWVPWGPLFPMTAPVDGDFAWINQGGASVVTTFGGIYLTTPLSASVNYRIRKKAAPSTPYTITAWLLHNLTNVSNQSCGICFRQSSDGKLVIFALDASATGFSLGVFKFTNPTTFSATYVSRAAFALGPQICLRIADNATNRICSVSTDGQNFKDIHSVGRTDFLTADEVGFFVNDQSNTIAAGMTLLSWKQA